MYKLNFIEVIQGKMQEYLAHKEQYMKLKIAAQSVKEELNELGKKGAQIKDKNSKEYADVMTKLEDVKARAKNIAKAGKKEEKNFDKLKEMILRELRKNKQILEKYKDVKDDKTIEDFKSGTKEININLNKLDEKIYELSRKLELNKLTKDEIAKLDKDAKKEALEAREQYLNNKNEYEKYEKLKYVTLLGSEIPKKRIYQCESAIAYIEKNFEIENIEDVMSKLEAMLDIERQKIEVKFDAKNHNYTYVDARGKETKIDNLFEKQVNGKYKSILTEENIKSIKQFAKNKGLNRRQIKAIDNNIVMVLGRTNPKLIDNYLEAIKEGKEAEFDIKYDLRQKGVEKENKIDRKTLRTIRKSALKQKAKGLATVIRDKSKALVFGIFGTMGLTIAGGVGTKTTYDALKSPEVENNQENNDEKANQKTDNTRENDQKSNEDAAKSFKENLKVKEDKDKEETKKSEKKEDKEEEKVKVVVDNPENSPEQTSEDQKIVDEAMKGYYSKKDNNKQEDTSKQHNNSSEKKGDNTQEKDEVIIVDDKEKEDGEVIIVDDKEKDKSSFTEPQKIEVIVKFKDGSPKTGRIDRETINHDNINDDLEDYFYEEYEKAVKEAQQRHKDVIEAIEEQREIDEEDER